MANTANTTNASVSSAQSTKEQQLEQIAENANEILMTADTVFPFTIFPDTITIDRVKVTIKRRDFFEAGRLTSIQIDDILNAEANTGPFFGSLKLWTRFFSDKPLMIKYLRNDDAVKIKEILLGYIIARHREVDCADIDKNELAKLLRDLGKASVVK